jgi:hypothetical protein
MDTDEPTGIFVDIPRGEHEARIAEHAERWRAVLDLIRRPGPTPPGLGALRREARGSVDRVNWPRADPAGPAPGRNTVTVQPKDTDRYGRTVAVVILADGRSLNHELVRDGFAWWYEQVRRITA